MDAIVTTIKQGTRFYLTPKGYASDIPERAATYNYSYDAQTAADNANREYAWQGFRWFATYRLHGGEIVT